jgi:hypothetical protein
MDHMEPVCGKSSLVGMCDESAFARVGAPAVMRPRPVVMLLGEPGSLGFCVEGCAEPRDLPRGRCV